MMMLDSFRQNIYPVSYELVDAVKRIGFRAIIISTAAIEVALLTATVLGMDEAVDNSSKIDRLK